MKQEKIQLLPTRLLAVTAIVKHSNDNYENGSDSYEKSQLNFASSIKIWQIFITDILSALSHTYRVFESIIKYVSSEENYAAQ